MRVVGYLSLAIYGVCQSRRVRYIDRIKCSITQFQDLAFCFIVFIYVTRAQSGLAAALFEFRL